MVNAQRGKAGLQSLAQRSTGGRIDGIGATYRIFDGTILKIGDVVIVGERANGCRPQPLVAG
jgi:hypothetical protein